MSSELTPVSVGVAFVQLAATLSEMPSVAHVRGVKSDYLVDTASAVLRVVYVNYATHKRCHAAFAYKHAPKPYVALSLTELTGDAVCNRQNTTLTTYDQLVSALQSVEHAVNLILEG